MDNTPAELSKILHHLDELQAIDTIVIDIKAQTTIADYMVVCSGRSSRHVKSVAENLLEQMKTEGFPALRSTGVEAGEWALVDFGDYIVHIMLPDQRAFYSLEELWQKKISS